MVGADKYGMLHMEWKKASSFFLVITPYMTPFLVYHHSTTHQPTKTVTIRCAPQI